MSDYKGPMPEFPIDKNVLDGVKEPKIEFHGHCKVCEIPLNKEYENIEFCGDCADDLWKTIFGNDYSDIEWKRGIFMNEIKSTVKCEDCDQYCIMLWPDENDPRRKYRCEGCGQTIIGLDIVTEKDLKN